MCYKSDNVIQYSMCFPSTLSCCIEYVGHGIPPLATSSETDAPPLVQSPRLWSSSSLSSITG